MALASDVALAGMRPGPAGTGAHRARLAFRPAPAPAAGGAVFVWEGRYGRRLDTLGDDWRFSSNLDGVFIVDRAVSRIDFHGAGGVPSPAAIDALTRRVLPRLAIATGALTLHGAALRRGGGAILMFGESGAGKSTLTAALARAGWHSASDDLTMIRVDTNGALIHPGATGVCVWADTRDGLMLDPARCIEMPGYDGKWRFEPEDEPDIAPVRLPALVYAPANRLLRAMTGVPAVKLIYPSGYAALPAVTDLLATLV